MLFTYSELGLEYEERVGVYPVSEDTLLLVEGLRELLDDSQGSILDMGCGTGLMTLVSARLGWDTYSADRDPRCLMLTRENLKRNGLSSILYLSDLFCGIPHRLRESLDIVLFNPPYLPSDSLLGSDPLEFSIAGGSKGGELSIRFIEEAGFFISDFGAVYLVALEDWVDDFREKASVFYREIEVVKRRAVEGERLLLLRLARGIQNENSAPNNPIR